jgi:hemolysin III
VTFTRDRVQTAGEELANSITHGLGLAGAAVTAPLLVLGAVRRGGDAWHVAGATVFGATLVFMYLASTLYHACPNGPAECRARRKQRLRTLDHVAIYLLIAGTYTPFLVGPMRGPWGWGMFAAEWTLAACGIAAKVRYGFRWPRLSTAVYVGMGWLAAVAFRPLLTHVGPAGFAWLLAGGFCYTAGVAFYATDWRLRYGHAVWHLFVAGGSACHVWAVLRHGGGVG